MANPKWTQREASPAEHFPHLQGPDIRNLELPQAKGPDGQPLVVTIRRIDALDAIANPQSLTGAEAHRFLAERSAPSLFEQNGVGPRWAALSLIDQMAILDAIADLNNEGSSEVAAAAEAFPGGQRNGKSAGRSGSRSGGDLADGASEPAASAAGTDVPATESGTGV